MYIEQSEDFSRLEYKVLRLKKALHELKQAPRTWNGHLDKHLQDNGFSMCIHEYVLYVKKRHNNIFYVCIYVVDDLIFKESNGKIV